jgi:hypothetical protein
MREYIRVDHQIMLLVLLSIFFSYPFFAKKYRNYCGQLEKVLTVDMGKFDENDLV